MPVDFGLEIIDTLAGGNAEFPVMLFLYQAGDLFQFKAILFGGAAIFGIGWGLGGFCPGPAMTALPLMTTERLSALPVWMPGLSICARQWSMS